jgi:hypothetical protein
MRTYVVEEAKRVATWLQGGKLYDRIEPAVKEHHRGHGGLAHEVRLDANEEGHDDEEALP